MLVLGFNGGSNLVHEDVFDQVLTVSHNSAAVLLDDGEVVAGIEQERLDRIKNSNKFPLDAIKFCLDSYGVKAEDVDAFAYYSLKPRMDREVKLSCLKQNLTRQGERPTPRFTGIEAFFQHLLSTGLGQSVPLNRFHFVRHHVTHLVSAYAFSGFERSLILSLDGVGDSESGRVAVGEGRTLETVQRFGKEISLGHFYEFAINYIGFKMFDEYKAMGLAPYGDPARFRTEFKQFYTLLPNGEYTTSTIGFYQFFEIMELRAKGEPFTQVHMDFAAALQEALEEIVFHILRHYRKTTGHTHLCLAGGVAHNCTMNGKIAASGMFENIFVQPAAHDAGCALGAALALYYPHHDAESRNDIGPALSWPGAPRIADVGTRALRKLAGVRSALRPSAPAPAPSALPCPKKLAPLEHLNWGTDNGDATAIGTVLGRWGDFITVERVAAIEKRAAELIAEGNVIGWVQGRSEFGPRALGNRSILADPRPAENKQIINAMVKKREGFRPFAPSVLEEDANDYFVLTGMKNSPFMIFVVDVREDKRQLLGAVTHVNGSARIQTVSRQANERYWNLINAFKALTGVPVVLNTSFNNHAEPIVDSTEDAVVCFLTTHLHCLIVGDYLVRKKENAPSALSALVPNVPRHLRLTEVRRYDGNRNVTERSLTSNCDRIVKKALSADAFAVLGYADGKATLGMLLTNAGITDDTRAGALLTEIEDLWSNRLVALTPPCTPHS